jgi:hypothetical protein
MMLDTIRDGFNNYAQQLPRDISKAAIKSASYSFVLSTLFSEGDIRIGVATAALAAIVSMVNSLTMPFFRKAFADYRGDMHWYHQVFSCLINLGISQLLINSLIAYRVNVFANAHFNIFLTLLLNGTNELRDYSTYRSPIYAMI